MVLFDGSLELAAQVGHGHEPLGTRLPLPLSVRVPVAGGGAREGETEGNFVKLWQF